MCKKKLDLPEFLWHKGVKKYYIGSSDGQYLRRNLEVHDSTGFETENDGIWNSYEEAMKYRNAYYGITQESLTRDYNNGMLMTNYKATTFKFLGRNYVSNPRRFKKYKFDDYRWFSSKISTLSKIKLIINGKFKEVHD